jgi:hypothetical protein
MSICLRTPKPAVTSSAQHSVDSRSGSIAAPLNVNAIDDSNHLPGITSGANPAYTAKPHLRSSCQLIQFSAQFPLSRPSPNYPSSPLNLTTTQIAVLRSNPIEPHITPLIASFYRRRRHRKSPSLDYPIPL